MANTNMSRQLVKTGTLSAGVLLVAALLLIVNYFGWKYHKRFDWTEDSIYTLSEKSENVLKDLKRDVEFVVFLPPGSRHVRAGPRAPLALRRGLAAGLGALLRPRAQPCRGPAAPAEVQRREPGRRGGERQTTSG